MIPAAALVWCPFPDLATARAAARVLLGENLVACANLIPAMTSLYIWEGAIAEEAEVGALFKTNENLREKVVARLATLHPYAQPTILAWHCDGASPATLAWLAGLKGMAGKTGGPVLPG